MGLFVGDELVEGLELEAEGRRAWAGWFLLRIGGPGYIQCLAVGWRQLRSTVMRRSVPVPYWGWRPGMWMECSLTWAR